MTSRLISPHLYFISFHNCKEHQGKLCLLGKQLMNLLFCGVKGPMSYKPELLPFCRMEQTNCRRKVLQHPSMDLQVPPAFFRDPLGRLDLYHTCVSYSTVIV